MVTARTPNYFYTRVLFLTIIPRIESSKWDMSGSQSTLLRFIHCFCVCTSSTVISLDFCLVMMPPPLSLVCYLSVFMFLCTDKSRFLSYCSNWLAESCRVPVALSQLDPLHQKKVSMFVDKNFLLVFATFLA